jgi:hypothetical protein
MIFLDRTLWLHGTYGSPRYVVYANRVEPCMVIVVSCTSTVHLLTSWSPISGTLYTTNTAHERDSRSEYSQLKIDFYRVLENGVANFVTRRGWA